MDFPKVTISYNKSEISLRFCYLDNLEISKPNQQTWKETAGFLGTHYNYIKVMRSNGCVSVEHAMLNVIGLLG